MWQLKTASVSVALKWLVRVLKEETLIWRIVAYGVAQSYRKSSSLLCGMAKA
jgi:hypothetical protein